jgi:hypothetical protein
MTADQAMPLESGILNVHFIYPDLLHIHIPSGFLFLVEKRLAIVRVQKHHHALDLVDFNNRMEIHLSGNAQSFVPIKPFMFADQNRDLVTIAATRVADEAFPALHHKLQEGKNLEDVIDWRMHQVSFEIGPDLETSRILRTRMYSGVIISYHVPDINNITEEHKNFYKLIFDRFIQGYRYAANDYRPRLFSEFGEPIWIDFSAAAIDANEEEGNLERQLRARRNFADGIQTADYIFHYHDQPFAKRDVLEATEELESVLHNERLVLDYEYLGAAKHAVLHLKNYAYGLLEAFIAVERMVTELMAVWKAKNGLSKKKIRLYLQGTPISHMINVEIMNMRSQLTPKEFETLNKLDRARILRNALVHRSKRPTEEDAKFVVETAEEFFKIAQCWFDEMR